MQKRFRCSPLSLLLFFTLLLTACGGGGGGGGGGGDTGGGGTTDTPTTVSGGTTGSGTEDQATPITGALSASDPNGLNDGTVYTVTTPAAHGTASINAASGAWSYSSVVADFNGSDSFTVTITDDAGFTITQAIALTVDPVADIVDDTPSTNEDTAVAIDVLNNDTFEGTPTVSSFTQGSNGAVVDNGSGILTYTPDAGWNGDDSFTYTVTSGGVTETATVSVRVNPVNDPTIIDSNSDTSGSGAEDALTPITGTLIASDADGLTNANVFSIVAPSGSPAHGSASIGATSGFWSYTPNTNYNGSDSFTVTITDDAGNTVTQSIGLTVTPVADPTQFSGDISGSGNEDGGTIGGILVASDGDGLGSNPFAITTAATHGTANINAASGAWDYIPAADYYGSDSFIVTVTDSTSATATRNIDLTISAVVDIVDDTATTSENTAVTIDVLANDSFAATAAVTSVTQGTNGSVTINADDSLTYTPNPGFNGSDSFTYTVTSGGATETGNVTVSVDEKPYFAYSVSSARDNLSVYALGKTSGRLKFIAEADLGAGADPSKVMVSPSGTEVFAVNATAGSLTQLPLDAAGKPGTATVWNTSAQPTGLALTPDGNFAYVINASDKSVDLIDLQGGTAPSTTNTLLGSVVGNDQIAIAVHPSADRLYLLSGAEASVTRLTIDPTTGALSTETPTATGGATARAMALTSDSSILFVVHAGGANDITSATVAADGSLGTFSSQASVGSDPVAMAIDPGGSYLYVVDGTGHSIYQFAIGSGGTLSALATASFDTGTTNPQSISIDPSGSFAYVADASDSLILQYSIQADGTLAANAPAIAPAFSATQTIVTAQGATTASPRGTYAYVTNEFSDTVSQFSIDAAGQLTQIATAVATTTGGGPNSVTVSPDGKYAYTANLGDNSIDKFTIGTDGSLSARSNLSTGVTDSPWAIAFRPQGDYAYVSFQTSGAGRIERYAVSSTGVLTGTGNSVAITGSPTFIAIDSLGRYVYVGNAISTDVDQFTLAADGTITANGTISLNPASAFSLTIDPTSRYLYTANDDGSVGAYAVQANGTLSSISAIATGGSTLQDVVVDPSGRYLYANADNGPSTDQIYKFDIGATGGLTAGTVVGLAAPPFALAINPAGTHVYSANDDGLGSGEVASFALDANGDLTAGSSVATENGTNDVTITGPWQ